MLLVKYVPLLPVSLVDMDVFGSWPIVYIPNVFLLLFSHICPVEYIFHELAGLNTRFYNFVKSHVFNMKYEAKYKAENTIQPQDDE